MSDLNRRLGAKITQAVGTMWAAYIFAGIALVSLPGAIQSRSAVVIVAWIAQTFLQLVLLAVIMVGQSVQAEGTESLIRETHDAVLAELSVIRASAAELHELARDHHALTLEVHAHVTQANA